MSSEQNNIGPTPIQVQFVVIWEDELKAAAKAISHLMRVKLKEDATDDEKVAASVDALRACYAALGSVSDSPEMHSVYVLANKGGVIRKGGVK